MRQCIDCKQWDVKYSRLCRKVGSSKTSSSTDMIIKSTDVLPYLLHKLGSTQVQATQSHTQFDLILQLKHLQSLHLDALGLSQATAIRMHVTLCSVKYYGGSYRPEWELSIDEGQPTNSMKMRDPHDKVLHQISKICEAFFAEQWPCQTSHRTLKFLRRLFRHVEARLPQLGNFCVVCGCPQQHTGLKPVPCNSEDCNFAFNERGIGADLRDINTRPVIADLLISMASAACQCINRRDSLFQNVPSDLMLATCGDENLKSALELQIDWQRMEKAFHGIPPGALMASAPNLQDLIFKYSNKSVQASTATLKMLRSVLNSCQGHFMQLQGSEQFPMMETRHQFRLCSDRPSKEAVFASLRSKYGSQFLFHGSPFFNWHSILRVGLKNMTNTDMMLNGGGYGSGIYFAKNSSTSASYIKQHQSPAWSNSIFGRTPQCIALCEVINKFKNSTDRHDLARRGIKLVAHADNVIIRYLFVYSGSRIPSIAAKALSRMCQKHAEMQAEVHQSVTEALVNI